MGGHVGHVGDLVKYPIAALTSASPFICTYIADKVALCAANYAKRKRLLGVM